MGEAVDRNQQGSAQYGVVNTELKIVGLVSIYPHFVYFQVAGIEDEPPAAYAVEPMRYCSAQLFLLEITGQIKVAVHDADFMGIAE